MFGVCVAAAIPTSSGSSLEKTNLLFEFEQPPAAAQVMSRSITAFSQLQMQRGNHNDFFINCAMIFDDNSSRWVPLERSNQICHNCQIYLFQPDVADVAGPIPEPIEARRFLQTYVSPDRSRQIHRTPRAPMPDYSSYNNSNNNSYQERPEPPQQQLYYQQQQQPSYNNYDYNNNYDNNNTNDGGALSPEQRAILRREAEKYDSNTYVAGGSILREERDKEERKIVLPVDSHRERVRSETKRFEEEISPSKQQRHSSGATPVSNRTTNNNNNKNDDEM